MTKEILLQAFLCLLFAASANHVLAQQQLPWHAITREVHYRPEGKDFILVNGSRRFNRALYGSNTAFRVEAGDLPEFALYLPGMGGNLKFGVISNKQSKWLINAQKVEARYRPGSMNYVVGDELLQQGTLSISVLPLYGSEGMIVKVMGAGLPQDIRLLAAFGGATGLKFSRDGDIGADPESSFYLKPAYCSGNIISISQNSFSVYFGSKRPLTDEERYEVEHLPAQKKDTAGNLRNLKVVSGIFPPSAVLNRSDATHQSTPLECFSSKDLLAPMLSAQMALSENQPLYFLVKNGQIDHLFPYVQLERLFSEAEEARVQLAGRIDVDTPDPYINTVGGAVSIAADAIWEDPSFMHGAVAWRMRLNGWRGAYAADVLGWHDRARKHFSSYAQSQVTFPLSGKVVADTALHLARSEEKLGNAMFSSGYISRNPNGDLRPHHYDMNLVFIDQLLNHFNWTGDTAYVRQMWPLLMRHLAWEKRNFDADGDGLYDAYAAIWASDALQYSGGGVTHSSAYNYRANRVAADLAKKIGVDPAPYRKEAEKIWHAVNRGLWMTEKGWYAEYRDLMGQRLLHPAAGLWTVYHAIDEGLADPFQSWQLLHYVDDEIPHIPIGAKDLADTTLYTLSTTNWQPYTWSLNNVVLAEVLHTALAYWQGGRNEEAFRLWKSTLVESMYLGASPGNIQQLSFYDAMRGELYRDFADGVGMTARSLVEGLFGIAPDLLHDTLFVTPGFPTEWDYAKLRTPDIDLSFQRRGNTVKYNLQSRFPATTKLVLKVRAMLDEVDAVLVNGKSVAWTQEHEAVGCPILRIAVSLGGQCTVEIRWKGNAFANPAVRSSCAKGQPIRVMTGGRMAKVYDPQQVLGNVKLTPHELQATILSDHGNRVFFIQLMQGAFTFWQPVAFAATRPVQLTTSATDSNFRLTITNNTPLAVKGKVLLNNVAIREVRVDKNASIETTITGTRMVAGTNSIAYRWPTGQTTETVINWERSNPANMRYEKINLSSVFNDEVNHIFNNQYFSPRPAAVTLQLPTQGIGNWTYPLATANINDSGLRARAAPDNEFTIAQGIPFTTPSAKDAKNIVFTSQWDRYPDSVRISLKGKSAHAYFLMAGSTNPMQSRLVNGQLLIYYKDGSRQVLELKNPENWWPIEQDYYEDGAAFTTGASKPVRVYLKTGEDSRTNKNFTSIRGLTSRAVDGGAASVLDLALDPSRELSHLVLKTDANDVVIGLMSVTLLR